MSISEKIKAISKKIEQNKAQYDLDRQTTKIFALSSRNISKYEFLTGKVVLPEKGLLEKAAAIKNIWIFGFRQRIKNTNWHCKEAVLDDTYKFDKI